MNDPKFRIWDKKNQKMIYVNSCKYSIIFYPKSGWELFEIPMGKSLIGVNLPSGREINFKKTELADLLGKYLLCSFDGELMQSLNLKDKDKKEIFVGDIRKGKYGYIWQILEPDFHEGPYCYRAKALRPGGKTYEFDESLLDTEYIGNIYENPDLILQGKVKA